MESGEHVAPVLGVRTKCQQSPEKKYNIESKTSPHSSKFVFLLPPIFQALLQSSASRKTQKKKKKKVCYDHPSFGRVNLIFLYSTFLGRGGVQISVCPYFPPSQL